MFNATEIQARIAGEEQRLDSINDIRYFTAATKRISLLKQRLATKRVIFKCRTCKTVRSFDYVNYPDLVREVGGIYRSALADAPCSCGRHASLTIVQGVLSDHVCNAKCTGATGPHCECSCGGANHGGKFL